MNVSLLIICIFYSILVTINGACDSPSLLKSQLVSIVGECSVVKQPTSRIFVFPVFFILNPSVFLSIILNDICLTHLLTSDYRSLFDFVFSLNITAVESSHLMTVQAFVKLMFVLIATDSSTARAFLAAYNYAYIIYICLLVFRAKFT